MSMRTLTLAALSILLLPAVGQAQEDDGKGKNDASVTVAVLSFDARDPSNADLGVQLSEMVTAVLSGSGSFEMVDRTSLDKTLAEHELNLTGLVSAEQAIKVGKLVGAKILVTGRAFQLGNQTYLTAKLIGTETTRVDAVLVKAGDDDQLGELAMMLSEKIDERITKRSKTLTGADIVVKDPLPPLIAALAKRKDKPLLAVVVTETHVSGSGGRGAGADPAVETEIKRLLGMAGYEIKDVGRNALADWAPGDAWPQTLEGVDLVVTGESLSEFGARVGNLVSCAARAELNVIRRSDGRVVHADRSSARAVDLSENIAGRAALQKAGRVLAASLMEHLLE